MCGSPERCEFRCVLECGDGGLYVLERINSGDVDRKQRIIDCLNHLCRQSLAGINPYLATVGGTAIARTGSHFWQLSRYVGGSPLPRPGYVFERWRAAPLSDFLIRLNEKSDHMPGFDYSAPFSIVGYINTLVGQIRQCRPQLRSIVEPVVNFLEKDFWAAHDRIPPAFCHGDFHAVNIIWSDTGINAVIDWEFCGIKPEIYDIANMIGCIGVENPEALAGDLVLELIDRLKKNDVVSAIGWSCLVEFVTALRFAWLSEWLRHNDEEMIALETDYMKLLVTHAGDLREIWWTGDQAVAFA